MVANLVCRTEAPVMKSFHSSKSPFTLLVWNSTIYLNLSRHNLNPHQPQLNLKAQCLKITQNVAFELFQFWHFPPIFVLLKLTCLVTLFDRKLQVFKNSPKLTVFGIFNELLSTQDVNVARFARNVE